MAKPDNDILDHEKPAPKPMSLAGKAGIFTLSRAVTIITQMLAGVVLAHVLSKEDNAVVSYLVLTLYTTALAFGQLGLPDSVFFFFEKMPPNSRKAFTLLLSKTLFYLAFGAAVIMLTVGWLGATREGFGEVRTLVWVMAAMLLLELPTMPLPNVLIATDRTKAAAWFNIFTGMAQFMAMTIPLLLPNPVAAIPIGLLIYSSLKFGVSTTIFQKIFKHEPIAALPEGTMKEVLHYSIPLSLAQIFWVLNKMVDKQVVQWLLPSTVFAVYNSGAIEIPIIPTIAYTVSAVMMTQLVGHHLRGERAELLGLWYKSIHKVSVIVLPLVMIFLVAAEEFIALLLPPDYADAVIPFRIYTFILLQRVASYSNMQKALGATAPITYAAIYMFLINAVLCVPLVMWLGMAGPPLAMLLANVFSWWYALRNIQQLLKIRFREVFPFRFYAKALGVAALAALPVLGLKMGVELPRYFGFFILTACYLPIYLVLAKATGIIEAADWRRLMRKINIFHKI
ncbi:MAG: oligosaccharide flippase family protein [Saprospiraceae bacterium]|nr:oligosaccharide flippase family protein [Saprospiraceae bacterium]MCF8249498.1 oligosaccharide flippase family protein [Saprospiraceae bacterium]MCF8280123.1 oligosaccharide flippase family protein [Bacteroidales bacterium]MCF8310716.1 oligosaccharide flippase family protein [Saprospiraceae bacterium]MCF8439453.1 oligosaccharide flippase family protein [Saprospiraceae bacterium]